MSPFMGVTGLGGAGSLIAAREQTDLSKKYWYIHLKPTFSSGVIDQHVDVDSEGNIFTAARYSSSGSGGNIYHTIVAKYDTFGVFQWQKSFAYNGYSGNAQTNPQGTGVDNDGNFYIGGWIYPNTFGSNHLNPMFIIKYNSSGDIQWQRELDTYRSEYHAFKVDGSGNVYVGSQVNNNTYSGGNPLPYLLAKYNSSGVLQWKIQLQQPYVASGGGQNMEMEKDSSIEVDSSGNVILTGTIDYNSSNFRGGYVVKFNSSGVMQWQRRLDIGNNTFDSNNNYDGGSTRHSIACDRSDNIYITGSYRPYDFGGHDRTVLVKYDSSGTLQWSKVLRMDEGNYYKKYYSHTIGVDTNNNVYILGNFEDHKYRESNSTASTAIILTKWDSSGNLQYERTIDAPEWYNQRRYVYGNPYQSSYSIQIDDSGSIKLDSENNLYFAMDGFAPRGLNSSWGSGGGGISIFKIPSDGLKTGAYQNLYYRPFPDIYNGFREDYHQSGFVGITSTKDMVGYAGSLTSTTDTLHTDSAGNLIDNSSSVSLWNTATILISDKTDLTSHVTDGLSFHIDAGDTSCVSWTGRIGDLPSGTYEVNSLVGSITSSNINTQVAHSPSNGGYWIFIYGHIGTGFGMEFDGDFADVTGSTDFSYDFWFRHRWYGYSYNNPFGIIGLSKTAQGAGTWGGAAGNEHLHSFIGDQTRVSGSTFIEGVAYYKLPTYDVNDAVNGFNDYSFSPIKSTGNWDDNGGNWEGNDNWWHVAVTFDTSNTQKKVYVNGTLINTITNSAYSSIVSSGRSGTGRLYVGGMTGYNPLNGDVAIVRFYKNKILSASEVLQNYNAEKTRFGLNYSATAYT